MKARLCTAAAAAVLAAGSLSAQTGKPLLENNSLPGITSSIPAQTPVTPERRGDILMAQKKYREAVEVYREGPLDSPVIWNKIGIAYHQMQQLDTARKNYERSVKLNPKYSEAVNNLGTVYYAKKSYRKAISYYRRALKLAPNSASIYSNLGTALFARKKYSEAFEAYQQAMAIDPEVFEHRSSYGVLLQERSVEERAKFHFYLAKAYAKAGRTELALQYLRKSFEEGYKDRAKVPEEPEFKGMLENVEFQELMKSEPKVL